MIALTIESPTCNVVPLEGGIVLQFVDEQSGIVVNVPMPSDVAAEIGKALGAKPKVDVVPASALNGLK